MTKYVFLSNFRLTFLMQKLKSYREEISIQDSQNSKTTSKKQKQG